MINVLVKYCSLFLFLVNITCSLFAMDSKKAFEAAKQSYENNNYKEAITLYQGLLTDHLSSVALHYNLGNAYFKNSDIGLSILHFEKAKKLAPADEEIITNLELAYQKTRDKTKLNSAQAGRNWISNFIHTKPTNFWATLSIILSIIGFGGLIIYLLTQSVSFKKTAFVSGVIAVCLMLITTLIAANHKAHLSKSKEAIILTSFLKVKSDPAENSSDLFNLHEGTKVKVVKIKKEWIEISPKKGNVGWVKKTDIGFI